MGRSLKRTRRGGALLSALWLTAALAAIAFSVATLVRGEVDRATNSSEGTRAYFLARGGLERFFLELEETALSMPGIQQSAVRLTNIIEERGRYIVYPLPEGEVHLELIPESSKLDLNVANPAQIERILLAMNVEPDRIQRLTLAILDWRGALPLAPGAPGPFDAAYLSRQPSFRPPRASYKEIEELLLVEGMTPEIFHGGYHRTANGTLVPHAGLRDCFTVFGATGPAMGVDILSAAMPLLLAGGVPPAVADEFVRLRQAPGVFPAAIAQRVLGSIIAPAEGGIAFTIGARSIYTIRVTARLRAGDGQLSETRRSISAQVKWLPRPGVPYQILRWDDNAISTNWWTEARH